MEIHFLEDCVIHFIKSKNDRILLHVWDLNCIVIHRNAEKDEEHFETCLRSLEEEIMFNAGHLLTDEEPEIKSVDQPEPTKLCLKRKPGRGFCHAISKLYICDSGMCGDNVPDINNAHLSFSV